MSTELMFALVCALAGIGYGVLSIFSVLSKPRGDDEMVRIQNAIQEGASAYLKRQYLSLIHISEPTRPVGISRMPSSA